MQRTTENFPRMKVRGQRRRQRAQIHEAWRGIANAVKPFADAFAQLARAAEAAARVIANWYASVVRDLAVVEWLRAERVRIRRAATRGLTTGKAA